MAMNFSELITALSKVNTGLQGELEEFIRGKMRG
jgi:hypothetical protein